jgi:HEAT repeat protein
MFAVTVLVSGWVQGGEAGGESDPEGAFRKLKAEYDAKRRDHSDKGNAARRNVVERMGDLKYAGSIPFLKKVFQGEKTPMLQVAAIVALGKVGTLQAVQIAFQKALSPRMDDLYRDAMPWGMRFCHDEKAAAWVAKFVLRNRNPKVRLSAVECLGVMGCKSGVEGLIKCLKDRDLTILYETIRALGMIGDERARDPIHTQCGSTDWRLREACAFALGSFKDEKSFALLKTAIKDEEWKVRESAVFSFRRINNKEAVEPLIAALNDTNRRVAVEIRETLKKFTGKDFGFDIDLWRAWWRAKGKEDVGKPKKHELTAPATYHGLKIESNRVLFITDVSGSMEWGDRIIEARVELSKALKALEPKTLFNIMVFSDNPLFFRKEMVPASKTNVERADIWMSKQRPFSGTNTFDNGIPTRGKYLAQEKILAELNKMNRYRKIRVHTIAFLKGESPEGFEEDKEGAERFMKRLAEENHGKSVCVK